MHAVSPVRVPGQLETHHFSKAHNQIGDQMYILRHTDAYMCCYNCSTVNMHRQTLS